MPQQDNTLKRALAEKLKWSWIFLSSYEQKDLKGWMQASKIESEEIVDHNNYRNTTK